MKRRERRVGNHGGWDSTAAPPAPPVTLVSLGSLLNDIPASVITVRSGERGAIVVAGVWSASGMALCLLTHALVPFAAGCFMVGMSQAVYNLARQSYLAEAVPAAYRARAMSTLGGSMRIGMFIGPFFSAGAVHLYGISAAFVVGIVGVLRAAGAGDAASHARQPSPRLRDRRRRHPVRERGAGLAPGRDPAVGRSPSAGCPP